MGFNYYAGRLPPTATPTGKQPPAPLFRWTLETFITRTWVDRSLYRNKKSDVIQRRTVTVLAHTEEEAKEKVLSAIPAPPEVRDEWDIRDERHERSWFIAGEIEEIEW